jgi:hypothetical protein
VRARLLFIVGGLMASGMGKSEPLSTTPFIGLDFEYSSNPFLLATEGRAVNDVAVLLNSPTMYDLDGAHFSLTPRIRYSDSGTYASLNSNSLHLDASAQFSGDLQSFTVTASRGRDSSLYYSGLSSNGVGVRTDSIGATAAWVRELTPRLAFEQDVSWQRADYANGAISSGLRDYQNTSLAPSLLYALDERDTLSVLGTAGLYKTIDGITESKSLNIQMGLDHKLTEIWNLSASAGYSRADNSFRVFFGPFLLGSIETQQKGPLYKLSLSRKGELLNFSATLSRAFVPSGFAFLSRQNNASVSVGYTYSERWTFVASGNYQRAQDPLTDGGYTRRSYFSTDASIQWHWTPVWSINLHATRVNARSESFTVSTASNSVSLEIARQFLRMDL